MHTKRSPQEQAIDGLIRRKLEAAGVRPTRQRVDLGRVIFGAGDRHFTAEMIYQETRVDPLRPDARHDLQHAQRIRPLRAPARDRDLRR